MMDKVLAQMERDVAKAKEAYQRAADKKRHDPLSAHLAWGTYARLLHTYRLEVRKHG